MTTAARKTAAPKKPVAKPAEPVAPEVAEEEPTFTEFEYKGRTYKVPSDPQDVPMDVVYAESPYEIVEEIVGPDQWVEFRKTRPTVRQFHVFADLVFDAAGWGDDEAGN